MKTTHTKHATDRKPITPAAIRAWNKTYNEYPLNAVRRVTSDGEGVLINMSYQPLPCGCKVTGNGTLQFPLTVTPCPDHLTASRRPKP